MRVFLCITVTLPHSLACNVCLFSCVSGLLPVNPQILHMRFKTLNHLQGMHYVLLLCTFNFNGENVTAVKTVFNIRQHINHLPVFQTRVHCGAAAGQLPCKKL